ncbi:PREDICTED: protein FAM49A-like [Amphimedon queenslandica]|uniref:CYRIA/CYRIB Rac1 binding domain-containing protein n=1 Tax=Amphimedon queenslandica TaxID=400682 RepID=A0A1X7TX82_AMPQE|nr:PREDICTED: protein FAM49A-like [Amphimedon queenslandica]|eukprot:XP_003389590.1 PREDICTED: protein FAM49A-like [Amphimedon queenslandica]
MGNLLRVLNDKGPVPKVDFYVDFESAEPTDAEKEVYSKVSEILTDAPRILEELRSYKGAGESIREAISNPQSSEHQEKAWQMVCPLVQQLKSFYEYALSLEKAVCDILVILCLPTMAAIEHLEKQQAITKQLAHILDFTLAFDDLKMGNPQIQNDFSYYRRTLNRRKMEDLTSGVASSSDQAFDLPDDMANRMSLFYANPTPILHGLAGATSQLLKENSEITLDLMTDCLCTTASVCRVINENAEYKTRFQSEETVIFTLRVMVGAIILYDHLHPVGAFAKRAPIDMKASIKIIKEHPSCADGLINALKYNTKHFNDEATPRATKTLLST